MNEKNLIELRLWSEADLPLLEQLMGDPVMTEHLGGPETPEKILKRHERYCQSSRTGKDLMFAIVIGPENTAVGSIGYWEKEWNGQHVWETGWSILPQFQGHGIATRATAQKERVNSFMLSPQLKTPHRTPFAAKQGSHFWKK